MTSRPSSSVAGLSGDEAERGVALEHRLRRAAELLHLEPVVHHRQRRQAALVGGAGHLGQGRRQGRRASRPGQVRAVDRQLHLISSAPRYWCDGGVGELVSMSPVSRRTYRFATSFTLEAPRSRVHDVLLDLEHYCDWWPQVRAVGKLDDDHALVICRSALPYDLELLLTAVSRDDELLEVGIDGPIRGWARFRPGREPSSVERGRDHRRRVRAGGAGGGPGVRGWRRTSSSRCWCGTTSG